MNLPALQKLIKALSAIKTRQAYEETLKSFSSAIVELTEISSLDGFKFLKNRAAREEKFSLLEITNDLEKLAQTIQDILVSEPGNSDESESSVLWLQRCISLFLIKKYYQVELIEEARKFQVALEILVEPGLGFALVEMDMRINYCNAVMREEFEIANGGVLPEALNRLVQKKPTAKLQTNPLENFSQITTDYNFFNWNNKNYRVTVRLLNGESPQNFQSFWAITTQPALDAFSRTNRLAQRVGLSWREVEICSLLHDGLDPNEVSNRLFISKHTVKTYLKRIYRKCGVHSRAQLIALLNQYSGNKYVV